MLRALVLFGRAQRSCCAAGLVQDRALRAQRRVARERHQGAAVDGLARRWRRRARAASARGRCWPRARRETPPGGRSRARGSAAAPGWTGSYGSILPGADAVLALHVAVVGGEDDVGVVELAARRRAATIARHAVVGGQERGAAAAGVTVNRRDVAAVSGCVRRGRKRGLSDMSASLKLAARGSGALAKARRWRGAGRTSRCRSGAGPRRSSWCGARKFSDRKNGSAPPALALRRSTPPSPVSTSVW